MNKIWRVKDIHPQRQVELSNALNIPPFIAQLLINRGISKIDEAKTFLNSDLSTLHDPFSLKGMREACDRIKQAKAKKEKVLVYGDYDVDGVTSSTILYHALTKFGLEVINYIPHRVNDGYGLTKAAVEILKENKAALIITIDCGITALDEVESINTLGVDVIIIDHHQPLEQLPKAFTIINPKQKGCPYYCKDLASVGLAFKLAQALHGKIPEEYLELVALGTIADVVPLRGENRLFVRHGLSQIHTTQNKGLMALLDVAKIQGKKISPYHVGFILGPRINAAGRMASAHKSLELFLSNDLDQAYELARLLEKHNSERQRMQRSIVEEAFAIIEQEVNFKDQKVIVLSKEGWHKGILGIVASKVTEKYYRPSVIISLDNGIGTASARSIEGFHLHEALSSCSQCLVEFGGHEGAAGLKIKEDNIDTFRNLINKIAEKTLENIKLSPVISIDAEIPLSSVDMNLVGYLEKMEPFGEGNAEPVFCSRKLTIKSQPQIMGKETIKFWVSSGKTAISAVGFGMARYKDFIRPGEVVDLAYQITVDDWNKEPQAQLKLKDIQGGD